MKTNEKKSTNHQPATQKPFFGAAPHHTFFSAENGASTPFFQPKLVLPSAIQAKSATSEAEDMSQPVVQRFSVAAGQAYPDSINIDEEEQRGGHTLERHIRKNERWLKDRAQREGEDASTYTSVDVAANMTKTAIQHNWAAIQGDWQGAARAGRNGNISYNTGIQGQQFYYCLITPKGKRAIVSRVKVFLGRQMNNGQAMPNNVFVLTSFPSQ